MKIVLTEKWLPCVPLIQILCVVYLFQPIHTANIQAIKAVGRSDICLKLEIIKKTIELFCLFWVVRISVNAIAVSMAVLTAAFTFVNAVPNSRLLNYRFIEQMADLCPGVAMSLVMVLLVTLVGKLPIPVFPLLIIQILTGGITYLALSLLSRNKEFRVLCTTVRVFWGRSKS